METSPKITINLLNKQANNGIVWTCSGNKNFGDLKPIYGSIFEPKCFR